MSIMKNINKAKVMVLKDQVSYQEGQIVSKTLVQNESVSITLFAFDKGEEISTHESGGDAFVTCLDGTGEITIDGVKYELHEGESIVMPAKHPHAVYGKEQYKMLLVVVFLRILFEPIIDMPGKIRQHASGFPVICCLAFLFIYAFSFRHSFFLVFLS